MSEMSSLSGKHAVITGSTQGLGRATAELFAERGAAGIVVTGRNAERGRAAAEELSAGGCKAVFVQADAGDVDACRRVIAAADKHFGSLHILANVAALTERGSIWDTTPEFFDRMMAVNVRAPFFLMQDAIKLMIRDGIAGSIVNVSSIASFGSEPFLCPYAASKGALNVLTKNVAYAVVRHQIRANVINLGWMDSDGEDVIQRRYHSGGKDWLPEAEAKMPFGRLLKPDEVARTIAYLASEESGMMTAGLLDLDQSVMGGGGAPIPPPMDEWPGVAGISYA